jgi:transcription termination factor Rho
VPLAERRIFPAINLPGTGTRREELILDPKRLDAVQKVRRVFATAENFYKATERLVERIEATKDNEAFINSLPGVR